MNILLVDDDGVFRKLIAQTLGNEHSITHANSALEALDILQEGDENFDVIITDMQMPLMNGVEFIEALATAGLERPCLLHSTDECGVIPGEGYTELRRIREFYPFVEFHSKLERNYIKLFLAHIAEA